MKILYRAASLDDLDHICHLVENVVKQMERDKIYQWDSIYPTKEYFCNEIKKNELYTDIIDGEIVVTYTLNKACDEQYKNGK